MADFDGWAELLVNGSELVGFWGFEFVPHDKVQPAIAVKVELISNGYINRLFTATVKE